MVRDRRIYGRCGGRCGSGMDLSNGESQRPFLGIRDASGVTMSKRQQTLGLGIVLTARHRSSRWHVSGTGDKYPVSCRSMHPAIVVRDCYASEGC